LHAPIQAGTRLIIVLHGADRFESPYPAGDPEVPRSEEAATTKLAKKVFSGTVAIGRGGEGSGDSLRRDALEAGAEEEAAAATDGRALGWLPAPLPRGVSVVLSCGDVPEVPGFVALLRSRHGPTAVEELGLSPLSPGARASLAESLQVELERDGMLARNGSLSAEEIESLVGEEAAGNPFQLNLSLREYWHPWRQGTTSRKAPPKHRRRSLAGPLLHVGKEAGRLAGCVGLILERAEVACGEGVVRAALCLLWAARDGLSEVSSLSLSLSLSLVALHSLA